MGQQPGISQSAAPTIGRVSSIGPFPSSRRTAMTIEHATKYYKTQTGSACPRRSHTRDRRGRICLHSWSIWLWQEHAPLGAFGLHELTNGRIMLNGTPVTGPRPEIGMIFPGCEFIALAEPLPEHPFPFEIKKINPKKYEQRIKKG